jgi:hypothetical protein
MAATSPLIRDRVTFVAAYAPYASMATLARDIAGASQPMGEGNRREPWQVDPLTRTVFVHALTALLPADEGERLRSAFESTASGPETSTRDVGGLSVDGRAIFALLSAQDDDAAERALHDLPPSFQARLAALSSATYLPDLRAPLIVLLHDRGDPVIPVAESRQLLATLAGRPGVHYTEMRFQHLDPVKGHLPRFVLARELGKFYLAVYPLFRQAVTA